MKIHTSRLSTNQLIQLSQQVLNPSDMRHVGALMRAHVSGSTPNWNREELIAFITVRNGGTPPDQILENMASAQLRKEVETKQPVQQDGVVLRVIDLGKQGQPAPQDPRAAMFVNCATCNKQIAVPAAQANQPAFCSQKCFGAAKNQAANDEHAMLVFMQSTPQFYPCEVNFKEIGDQLERWKKTNVTTD